MELQFVNSKRTNKAIIVLYDIDDIDIDLLKDRYIVGADKGAYLLLKKGIVPDIAIGDFDSCNDDEKKYIFDNIKNIIKLNPIKDKSDTKECIEYLKDYDDIIVYGGIKGNRIEHLFSNIIDICNHPNVKMIDDNSLIEIKDKSFIPNINYQFVSFYSLDNNTIILLSLFKYNLDNYNLKILDNLCLSNEIISNDCYVSLNGKILIIYSLKK